MSSKRRNLSALVFLINSTTKANLIITIIIIILIIIIIIHNKLLDAEVRIIIVCLQLPVIVFTKNTYILLDVLLCSIAEYFYELCRILASP